MKENSIKEDIKNAEHFIKSIKTDKEYKEENGWHGYYNKEIVELARILQHILSDYKRILKENEELKNGTRRNENELEVSIDGDWDALKKALDEAEKTNEYIIYDNGKWIKEKYCIPVQEVKDKVEEYKNMLKTCNKAKDIERIKAINERILELEELIERRK